MEWIVPYYWDGHRSGASISVRDSFPPALWRLPYQMHHFRFEAFGRPVRTAMLKKFEEGVFSDLRNLKPGVDASLEEPKACFYI